MGKSQSQCSLDVNMDICLFGARHSQEQDEKKIKLTNLVVTSRRSKNCRNNNKLSFNLIGRYSIQ